MRKNRLLWLCSVCLLFSGLVFADSVPAGDPVIQVDDPVCPEGGCPQVFAQQQFTFSANANGGGTTTFQVGGDIAFTTIDIETRGIFNSIEDVQCLSNKFTCQVSFLDGVTDMYFTANSCGEVEVCFLGFQPGDIFSVDLDNFDTPGIGGWGAGREFFAIADVTQPTSPRIPTPEPSSLLLLPAGALLINKWKRAKG